MRLSFLRLGAGALAALAASAAVAGDFPARKPGLWEMSITGVGSTARPIKAKICLDQATADALIGQGTAQAKAMCSKREVHFSGNTGTADSVCKIAGSTQTSHADFVFDGDTAYHVTTRSHYDPPLRGKSESSMKSDARWVGACPADMKPGDMITPTGARMHIPAGS